MCLRFCKCIGIAIISTLIGIAIGIAFFNGLLTGITAAIIIALIFAALSLLLLTIIGTSGIRKVRECVCKIGNCALLGAITTIIVSNVVSNERSNSNNDHAQQSEVQQNEIQNNQKEEKYTYKGSVLRALDKEFLYSEGEIKDVYGDIETYLLIGNGVYTMSRKELEKQYEVSSNATKILQCSGSSCIIETSDGKIEIYGADYEVKDIETQGEFGYGYKGVATPNYNLITLENGELTLNQFNLTTKENKTEEKLPIRIWNSKSPTQYEGKAKYYDGDVILLDNNDLHYLDRSTKNITNTEEPKAKNVEKVLSKSSASYFKTPFYAKVGDNKNVYVLNDEAKHPYYNDTEHLISIELIDDYVTSDIKRLYEDQ